MSTVCTVVKQIKKEMREKKENTVILGKHHWGYSEGTHFFVLSDSFQSTTQCLVELVAWQPVAGTLSGQSNFVGKTYFYNSRCHCDSFFLRTNWIGLSKQIVCLSIICYYSWKPLYTVHYSLVECQTTGKWMRSDVTFNNAYFDHT